MMENYTEIKIREWKVGELIEELKKIDPTFIVKISYEGQVRDIVKIDIYSETKEICIQADDY